MTIGATTERLMNYDASGNLITDNRGTAGNFAYVLNRSNRIASVTKGGVAQATYLYDAFERLRVRTLTNQTPTTNNGATHYVWDLSGQIIAEANGATGATLRETVYLEGMPLAAIDAAASPKRTYAVHVDHLHRPIMLTDAAKTNVWWARYEPFGRVHATGGTLTQNLGLPGQWFQLETGLAYNWHRHYDPTTGRYTTADPLGFVDGPSVFAYAGNNPHRVVDPTGTCPWCVALGLGALLYFDPSPANAPGWNDRPLPNNDLGIFENALSTALGGAGKFCRPAILQMANHTKNTRPSSQEKHEKGDQRRAADKAGEDGDKNRIPPRKRPDWWGQKGPWPPTSEKDRKRWEDR